MVLSGTLDVATRAGDAPLVHALDTETWELPGAEVLSLLFEIDQGAITSPLPRALHPTIPPTINFFAWKIPESPVGPFTMCEARIGSRIAVRPRGYSIQGYCNSAAARAALAERWGYSLAEGDVEFRHLYDRVVTTVAIGGETVLDIQLEDPIPISGGDILYTANMNLARVLRDGVEVPRLLQVDPEYTFDKAERGTPLLRHWGQDAWNAGDLRITYPVSASYARCTVHMPKLRYIVDPDTPAGAGTEKV